MEGCLERNLQTQTPFVWTISPSWKTKWRKRCLITANAIVFWKIRSLINLQFFNPFWSTICLHYLILRYTKKWSNYQNWNITWCLYNTSTASANKRKMTLFPNPVGKTVNTSLRLSALTTAKLWSFFSLTAPSFSSQTWGITAVKDIFGQRNVL